MARKPTVRVTANFERNLASVERLRARMPDADVRQYVFNDYLLLYRNLHDVVYLLSIKHHRQLSFDLDGIWIKEQRAQYAVPSLTP